MKIYKLKKNDLKNLEKLYKKIDVISKDGKQAFVGCVYISPKTEKTLRKVTKQTYKKLHPHISDKALAACYEMYLLNLGPCVLTGLPDNVILVDTKSVGKTKENFNNAFSNGRSI